MMEKEWGRRDNLILGAIIAVVALAALDMGWHLVDWTVRFIRFLGTCPR